MMLASDIMSTPVVTIGPDANLEEAGRRMIEGGVGSLAVVDDDGRLVGLITEASFMARKESVPWGLLKAPKLFDEWLGDNGIENVYDRAKDLCVGDLMAQERPSVAADDELDQVVHLMLEHEVKHVPVVDADGRPVGMISRHDLLRVMVERHQADREGPDPGVV